MPELRETFDSSRFLTLAGRCHECPRIAIFGPPPAAAPILVSNSTFSSDAGAAAGAGREDWSGTGAGPAPPAEILPAAAAAADDAPIGGRRTRQAVGTGGPVDNRRDGHVHAVGSGQSSRKVDSVAAASAAAASAAAAAASRALLLDTQQPSFPMPTHGQGEKGKVGRKGTRGGEAERGRAVHCSEHRFALEVVLVGGICQVVSPVVIFALCLAIISLPVRVSIFGALACLPSAFAGPSLHVCI